MGTLVNRLISITTHLPEHPISTSHTNWITVENDGGEETFSFIGVRIVGTVVRNQGDEVGWWWIVTVVHFGCSSTHQGADQRIRPNVVGESVFEWRTVTVLTLLHQH